MPAVAQPAFNIAIVANTSFRARIATPWHLWVAGALFLFLYAIGAYDYVQSQTQNASYFESQGYGPAQIEYFTDYPVVPLVFWTLNIVAGLAAALALLLRSRWSVVAASISAISILCLDVITFGFMDRWSILGPRLSAFDIGILVLTFALWFYSHRMRRNGVLR